VVEKAGKDFIVKEIITEETERFQVPIYNL